MNKTNKKHAALKNGKNNGFFKAVIFGFLSCFAVWIVLALVFAAVMSKQMDSTSLSWILSPVTVVVSLLVGGFVAGKADKTCAPLSSFVLGCAVLGLCYGLSSAMDLSRQLSVAMKTVVIAVMIVCPMIGASFSAREKKKKVRSRK